MKKKNVVDLWALDPRQPNLVVTQTQAKKGKLRFMKYKDTNKFLGFIVVGGRNYAPLVQPIYEATLHLQPAGGKDADTRYTFSTYEIGERLSGYSYIEDPEGTHMAHIASLALGFLQHRMARAKLGQARGRARDIKAFKAFAKSIGISLPVQKEKTRRVPRR